MVDAGTSRQQWSLSGRSAHCFVRKLLAALKPGACMLCVILLRGSAIRHAVGKLACLVHLLALAFVVCRCTPRALRGGVAERPPATHRVHKFDGVSCYPLALLRLG